jgi:hypothetical protein
MAGILFTDSRMVLAGYRTDGSITGIGGKKKDSETPYETAIREMLEEIFELEKIDDKLFFDVYKSISSYDILAGKYTIFVCTFDDLKEIIDIVHSHGIRSKVYNQLPKTIEELIFNRSSHPRSEFSHLVLLPYSQTIKIENYFMKDIKMFLKTMP